MAMDSIKWEMAKGGKLHVFSRNGNIRTLDTQDAIEFFARVNELEKFWNEKIAALEAQYFPG